MKIAGRTVPLRIHAILDDHSRFIVAIAATTTEREVEMLSLLVKAMRSTGRRLANALGHVATRHGYNVMSTRADAMLRRLKQSRMDNSREAVITELASIDLLIVDDLRTATMSRDQSRDIYQLIVERSGRAPTIVTSNRDTAERLAAFDETLLVQRVVDRVIHNAYDLVIEGESYRARLKPKLRTASSARVDATSPGPMTLKIAWSHQGENRHSGSDAHRADARCAAGLDVIWVVPAWPCAVGRRPWA